MRTPSVPKDLTQTQPTLEEPRTQPSVGAWILIAAKDNQLWEKRDRYIKMAALPEELWKCGCDCGSQYKEGNMVGCSSTNMKSLTYCSFSATAAIAGNIAIATPLNIFASGRRTYAIHVF